ncbi:MAG: hypothetical protein IJU79_06170 [Desulfovibrionaceae bacterium]|nr:hypothetical protein [Desulfovibrionaceae bacterium]
MLFIQASVIHAKTKPRHQANVIHQKFSFITNLRSEHIYSPKSAIFSADGKKFYVNALEGKETLVFDTETLEMLTVIPHTFDSENNALFLNNENTLFDYEYNNCHDSGEHNTFSGKPVESTLTHGGKYLWVTYYRRNCDYNASSPSAIAIIDTAEDKIVRVMPTGPLPKIVTTSNDGKYVAVTHWGDNTIGIIDISSPDPSQFFYHKHLIVGNRLNIKNISSNRDKVCGKCLRGTTFTNDSKYLLVSGMSSNKIYVFSTETWEEVGFVRLPMSNPRHFVINQDGTKLYASFNKGGKIMELDVEDIIKNAPDNEKCFGRIIGIGRGARTIKLSKDGQRLYAVCNSTSSLTCIDIPAWKIIDTISVAPYAVGLAINQEESLAIVTSQGRHHHGGNNVAVFTIK